MTTISKINYSDLDKFVELWNQGYELLTTKKFLLTFEKAKSGFNDNLFEYYGLFSDKDLIGFMLLKSDEDLWIKHMLIDKSFQSRGLGKLLLDQAKKIASEQKKKLKVEVLSSNNIAKHFFIKNDFIEKEFDKEEDNYILVWRAN